VGKGYAEGPALEERLAELELAQRAGRSKQIAKRMAVFGSTADQPDAHFLGWWGELDEESLFASGEAWGFTYRRVPVPKR
jgi:hypothetical protein